MVESAAKIKGKKIIIRLWGKAQVLIGFSLAPR